MVSTVVISQASKSLVLSQTKSQKTICLFQTSTSTYLLAGAAFKIHPSLIVCQTDVELFLKPCCCFSKAKSECRSFPGQGGYFFSSGLARLVFLAF